VLAAIRGTAIHSDAADAGRSNFPRHLDDLRRFQTPVYPLEQGGTAVADVAPLLRDKPDVIEYHRKAYTGS
jgi:hypothetical protein